jgi:3-methylcrotonyl-CoA carboxylase alpha subunit
MIAKLIVWGADRKQALARMAQALAQYQIVGLATNIAFLKRLVEGQAFATADLDTGLIERNHDSCSRRAAAPASALALAAVALLAAERAPRPPAAPTPPIRGAGTGWRMNQSYARKLSFADEHAAYDTYTYRAEDWLFSASSRTASPVA